MIEIDNRYHKDYIQRFVRKVNEPSQFKFNTLSETLKKEKRIVILGVAGLGKSVELERLSHEYSSEQSDLIPVLVSLANVTTQEIDEIIKLKFLDFDDCAKNKLLILLDGLDEVHTNYIDVVTKKINLFAEKFGELRIVVSCRNNFYTTEFERGGAKLEKFSSYVLTPIDWFSINNYIEKKVKGDVKNLLEKLEQRRLFELLQSPFYLVKIIQYYTENLSLPKSKKDVFEYLIDKRIEKDLGKYKSSGINIEKHTENVNRTLENIAMIMLYSGQNHMSKDQVFDKIITDESLAKVIEHTFLFNKDNTNEFWSFEHNNFKEYLAARYLSKLPLKQIKKIVSVGSINKKVKPRWFNTLSLLFSVMASEDKSRRLMNWIIRFDPDALVLVEKDKLELKSRERLFYLFYEDFNKKGILIRSEKFEPRDLALLVSDSLEILSFIVQEIDQTSNRIDLMNSFQLLKYFDSIEQYHNRIERILFSKIVDPRLTNEIKCEVFEALAGLSIYSPQLTSKILDNISLTLDEQYLRTGFYCYLESAQSKDLETHLNYLLDGILRIKEVRVFVNQKDDPSDIHLSEEENTLKRLFSKLSSVSSLVVILNWAKQQDDDLRSDAFYQIIGDSIRRCEKLSSEEKIELLSPMTNLLFQFCKRFKENLDEDFRKFFQSIDDPSLYLDMVLSKSLDEISYKSNLDVACGIVIGNKKSLDYIISKINYGEISDEKILLLRNALRQKQKDSIFNYFYEFIIKKDAKFEFTPSIDYDALRKKQFQRDRELLSSRDDFRKELLSVFDHEDTAEINVDVLYGMRRNQFSDEKLTNNIIVNLLRDFAEDDDEKMARKEEVLAFVSSDEKWRGYRFNKIFNWDLHRTGYEYMPDERKLMIEWLEEHVPDCKFRTALKQDGKRNSCERLEMMGLFLIRRLDFLLSEEMYLDILHINGPAVLKKGNSVYVGDEDSGIISWVISKTNLDAVKSRVMQNILDRTIVDSVILKYYKFCSEQQMEEVREYILEDINIQTFEDYEEYRLVDYYLGCGGELRDLVPMVKELHNRTNLHILDILSNLKSPMLISTCEDLILNESDANNKIAYIQKLLVYNENLGFEHQKNWILENEQFPDKWYVFDKLTEINLSDLLFLFQRALIKGFGETSWRGGGRIECFKGIIELGSSNKRSFNLVKKYINSWIEYAPDEKFLYYQIQKLNQEYYSKKSAAMSFEAAYDEVHNPFRFSIMNYVYRPSKLSVEDFGIKVGVIGIIVAILSVIITVIAMW